MKSILLLFLTDFSIARHRMVPRKKDFPIEKLKIFLASDRPTWPFEFLRKRRANSWHHSEEVLDGVLERECIEETCDFAEIHEIDDNLILANQKWNNYKKCHEKYGSVIK